MARRLPVYLLVDTSGSMSGEPIEACKAGIQMLVSGLRQDPQALEAAYLSVITFDSDARQVVPLTELPLFQPPELSASGTTAMGRALSLVAQCANAEVTRSTPEKGDWKLLVFILTDGAATDDLQRGVNDFKARKWGVVVACGVAGAEVDQLKKITDTVVMLDTADSSAFKAFFAWVSASVSVSSRSLASTGKELSGLDQLPPPPPEIQISPL
ncbi:MAG: VWA domain-containing protein [bacterium]|nr:VWA domain-containing protein [bacterium]